MLLVHWFLCDLTLSQLGFLVSGSTEVQEGGAEPAGACFG